MLSPIPVEMLPKRSIRVGNFAPPAQAPQQAPRETHDETRDLRSKVDLPQTVDDIEHDKNAIGVRDVQRYMRRHLDPWRPDWLQDLFRNDKAVQQVIQGLLYVARIKDIGHTRGGAQVSQYRRALAQTTHRMLLRHLLQLVKSAYQMKRLPLRDARPALMPPPGSAHAQSTRTAESSFLEHTESHALNLNRAAGPWAVGNLAPPPSHASAPISPSRSLSVAGSSGPPQSHTSAQSPPSRSSSVTSIAASLPSSRSRSPSAHSTLGELPSPTGTPPLSPTARRSRGPSEAPTVPLSRSLLPLRNDAAHG